ncbi:hypothetical protein BH11PSE5_BH11PSE5_21300 [soil metagenome]
MPSFGAKFVQRGDAILATLRDGRTVILDPHAQIIVASGQTKIFAQAATLVPDYMPSGDISGLRAWYLDRDRIAEIADRAGATITLPGHGTPIVAPLSRQRTHLSALSFDVWLLAIQAMGIGLLGIGLRVARPRDRRAWIFGLSCDGVFLAAMSGAVFDARELTANGTLLQLMQGLNFIGSNLCAVGLAALFLHVPRKIAPDWLATILLLSAASAGALEGIGLIPKSGFYAGLLIALMIYPVAFAIQWYRASLDPNARALLRWVGVWTFVGTATLALGMAAPIMLGIAPIASDGLSIIPLALVYGGIGFGVAGFRVFEIDRWAYRILLGAIATLALLIADAILVLAIDLDQPVALALSFLGIGYLYFPLRARLWRRSRGTVDLSSDALFRQATVVVFSAFPQDRRTGWRNLLDRVFEPLAISRSEESVDDPVLADDGEALIIPQTADEEALVLRFAGRGRRIFGVSDLVTARELIAMMQEAERARAEYGRGVADERRRLARDLHDDVSAHLLSGLHRLDVGLVREDIRSAMSEIRSMVASLSGPSICLANVLADIRYEAAQRLDAAGIDLLWQPSDDAEIDTEMLDYSRHKALVSSMREIVSNIVKHSSASRCAVDLHIGDAHLRLRVEDNGSTHLRNVSSASPGYGLRNIDSRLQEIGGIFGAVASQCGFVVTIEIPLNSNFPSA